VLAGTLRDARPAEHPCQFIDARVAVQRLEDRPRLAAHRELGDPHLAAGLRRDLWQVCDAKHLPGRSERAELPADHLGHGTADARVHFVEDQARQVRGIQRRYLQREADT